MVQYCLSLLVVVMVFFTQVAGADIYKYVDKYGRAHYTDNPSHSGYRLLVRTKTSNTPKATKPPSVHDYKANRTRFSSTIKAAAKRYQVPHTLLHAVITAESAYNPDAVSHKGAIGLMQLMPATAQRYGVNDPSDPVANISGGSRYLHDLLKMFNNDLKLALAAYNAGENTVIKYGRKIPPYQETQSYVQTVLEYYKQYQGML